MSYCHYCHSTFVVNFKQTIMITKLLQCFLGAILIMASGCSSATTAAQSLQTGDLLFQDLNCGGLCDAIETVTEGVNGRDFSHCALVVYINDSLKVVEAIGEQVQINSLDDFFERSGDSEVVQNIVAARLKPSYAKLIPAAVAFANQQVGKPYDRPFLLNNGSWYCSELVYAAFAFASKDKAFFSLLPMTFKDPATNDFFPAWVTYYNELGQAIPEGELGTNPGLISRSDKLDVIEFTRP